MMIRHGVQFRWENRGYRDFADYLAAFNHDKRKKVKQERRRVADAGVAFERRSGSAISDDDWAFFHHCYTLTYQAHRSTPYLSLPFFRRIGRTMGEHLLLAIGRRDGVPVCAALDVFDATTLWGRYWGALEYVPGLHFEACYYQAIEFCIERGIAAFEGGAQGIHKLARGLTPVTTHSAHALADPDFAAAVAEFCARERTDVAHTVDELAESAPFRRDGERLKRVRIWYTDHFVLPLPPGHRFPMAKYARLRERVAAVAPDLLAVPPAATDDELARAHDRGYIAAVVAGTLDAQAQRRLGFPWSPAMVERARRSAGATIAACRSALADGCGINLAGGTHHATRDAGAGFCVFNDAAVAARVMQAEGRVGRVVVIDLDVHQGDGTAAILAGDDSVFTFSLHGRRNFPFRKAESDLDVELDDGTGDGAYLATLATALPRALDRAQADLAIYLAGADPYVGDRLGRLALSKHGLAERDRQRPRRARGARPAGRDRHGRRLRRVDRRHRRHPRDDGGAGARAPRPGSEAQPGGEAASARAFRGPRRGRRPASRVLDSTRPHSPHGHERHGAAHPRRSRRDAHAQPARRAQRARLCDGRRAGRVHRGGGRRRRAARRRAARRRQALHGRRRHPHLRRRASAAARPTSGRLHPDGRADARRHRGAAPDAASGRRPGARRRGRLRAVAGQCLRPGRRQRRRVFRLGVPAHRADARRRRFVVAAAHRRHAARDGDHAARRALRCARPRGTSASSTAWCPRRNSTPPSPPSSIRSRAGPAFALRGAKRLVRESLSRTLSEQLQAEAVSFGRCTAQPDFAEGITAFLEKRAPKFGAS